ncbi:MAG: hydrogenase expression/formation protein HypE [bacterium]
MSDDLILLSHGSGGKMTQHLISSLFTEYFANPILNKLNDFAEFEGGERIVVSTDSFVIKPIFFPGGDIGKLSVCGTVNDVAVSGARVSYITIGFIIAEGFSINDLRKICRSMKEAAEEAGILIVAGDTKVVEKGAADGIYINTTGIGIKKIPYRLGGECACPGDKVIITGTIGDHGVAIMGTREGLSFQTTLQSDCAPLNTLIKDLLSVCNGVHSMRDPTRGGVATTLNEIAHQSGVGITLFEEQLPIRPAVQGCCDLLGLDPLYVANEGKLLICINPEEEEKALHVLRKSPYGRESAVIGEVSEGAPEVILQTVLGSHRVIDVLVGDQLPRIC